MLTPSILKQRDYLIATVQAVLTDEALILLRNSLVQQVGLHRSCGVILDVTGMDVMDSFSVKILQELAHMVRLRGAETVIVGIQPDVALSMIQLGLGLNGIATLLDLEEGLSYLDNRNDNSASPHYG